MTPIDTLNQDQVASLDETFQLIKAVISLRDEVHDLLYKVSEFMSKPEFKHRGCLVDERHIINKFRLSYKILLRLRKDKLIPFVMVKHRIYYPAPEVYTIIKQFLNNPLIKNDLQR
jgi:hypothetical protein